MDHKCSAFEWNEEDIKCPYARWKCNYRGEWASSLSIERNRSRRLQLFFQPRRW
ncbi:Hypothetical protein FKW44_001186 [Caligus rogercresseyi]|uniref:Uncharacterized protein n=1 Tax=Caligus rogercresseyi TaxID=217165 RepID=A0A7T8KIF9_CALRO|nr:Hypothetical protein FKW44_001186 [Caligus rogercresseyi]